MKHEIVHDQLTQEPDYQQGFAFDESRSVVIYPEFLQLYEQLMTYPRSPNDDILDALEMCLETAQIGRRVFDEMFLI